MFILILVLVLLITGLFILFMFIKGNENNLTTNVIEFDSYPDSFDDFRVFFISDIHRRNISHKLIEKIPGTVDVIIIGGDLVESGVPLERVSQNIKTLSDIAPIYFVFGNNDYEVGKENLEKLLNESGVILLNNTAVTLDSHTGEHIILLGVEDLSEKKDRLEHALGDCSEGFKILVSHNPDIYDKISSEDQISLILSGHTHGGQIRMLGLGMYKKGRLHYLKKATMLISNGYGTTLIPLRLGAPAEAHYIQLTKTK